MQTEAPARPSYPTAPRWTAGDFILTVLGGLAGAFLGALLAFGGDMTAVLLSGLVFQNLGHLVTAWWVARRRGATLSDIGLVVEPIDGLFIFLGMGLQLALSIAAIPIAERLQLPGPAQEITNAIDPGSSVGVQIGLILSVALLAPIAEEVMFRGILYQLFEQRRGFRVAVFGSAAVFSAFHLLGLTTENFVAAALITLPQLLIVGVVLANSARRRARLGVSIFIHSGFNLLAVLALLYASDFVTT